MSKIKLLSQKLPSNADNKYYVEFRNAGIDPSYCDSDDELAKELQQYTSKELSETFIYKIVNDEIKQNVEFQKLYEKYNHSEFLNLIKLEDEIYTIYNSIDKLEVLPISENLKTAIAVLEQELIVKLQIFTNLRKKFPNITIDFDKQIWQNRFLKYYEEVKMRYQH